ncbi:tetratricopeptide repeat protein [Alphaproteobacteria bacterium LSUCC0719]
MNLDRNLTLAKKHLGRGEVHLAQDLIRTVLDHYPANTRALAIQNAISSHSDFQPCQQTQRKNTNPETAKSMLLEDSDSLLLAKAANISTNIGSAPDILRLEAASYAKLGDTEREALKLMELIELEPNNSENYFNLGIAKSELGLLYDAAANYQHAITLNNDVAKYHQNLGATYRSLGDIEKAITCFRNALAINEDFFAGHFNLGNAYFAAGSFENAIASYKKTIALKPDFAEAHKMLAMALRQIKDIVGAIEAFEASLEYDKNDTSVLNNLGNLHSSRGELGQAITCFETCLQHDANHLSAIINLQAISLQYSGELLDPKYFKAVNNKGLLKSLSNEPKYLTNLAINQFIQGDVKGLEQTLATLSARLQKPDEYPLKEKDITFCGAYYRFLVKQAEDLTEAQIQNHCQMLPTVSHIGDSHCLSFAHRQLKLGSKHLRIAPKICLGLKAYHLATKEDNQYKNYVIEHFRSVPKNSPILLSAGEIDCRGDEGIIKAAKKHRLPIELVTDRTVAGYLAFVNKLSANLKRDIYLTNVPAPSKLNGLPTDINNLRKQIIVRFNKQLSEVASLYGFSIIDVHSFSKSSDGWSNNLFHCDHVHLGYKAFGNFQRCFDDLQK